MNPLRSNKIGFGRENLHQLTEALLDPVTLGITILSVGLYYEGKVSTAALIAGVLAFSITFPGQPRLQRSTVRSVFDILLSWFLIALLILFFGYATSSLNLIPAQAILTWMWVGPLAQVTAHLSFRLATRLMFDREGAKDRIVIVGMNGQGKELAKQLTSSPYYNVELLGFFDDRSADRLNASNGDLLGPIAELADYCKQHRVQRIYLSMPMTTQPRVLSLLDELRDTTASIFFVPDLFVTDLIQGSISHVAQMPVVSVCDTPFTGTNGLLKRSSDIVLSIAILILISPVLLLIGALVKLTSSGPMIFKQRRYGLEGEEIIVYKFRSMTVCEDGDTINQAKKDDDRITKVGAFLRKSSLDELPQFVNVLQGRMSIVGPRPHAVAHNELYRKLIKGYMIRHKVKPGITGWAQVNGLRGETQSLDRMQARIEHDLDYLRNWSLLLDLRIILMTVSVVFKDQYAY